MIVGIPKESISGRAAGGVDTHRGPATDQGGAGGDRIRRGSRGRISRRRVFRPRRQIVPPRDIFAQADIITQVLCYGSNDKTGKEDLPLFGKDQILIGFLRPLGG